MAALLAAGDNLSAWSKSGDTTGQEKKGMPTASGGAAAAAAFSGGGRELVAQIVAAGVRVRRRLWAWAICRHDFWRKSREMRTAWARRE